MTSSHQTHIQLPFNKRRSSKAVSESLHRVGAEFFRLDALPTESQLGLWNMTKKVSKYNLLWETFCPWRKAEAVPKDITYNFPLAIYRNGISITLCFQDIITSSGTQSWTGNDVEFHRTSHQIHNACYEKTRQKGLMIELIIFTYIRVYRQKETAHNIITVKQL